MIAREIALAKELIAAKKRERALLALKKKKLREGQLEKIDAYLLNVEQVILLTCNDCLHILPLDRMHVLGALGYLVLSHALLCRCWQT